MLDDLDLDQYNLTSDDLLPEEEKYEWGVWAKGHPLVPKLDFSKIFEWRDKQNQEEEGEEEESEEEELLSTHKKYLPAGSEIPTQESQDRVVELKQRKENVIHVINKAYAE